MGCVVSKVDIVWLVEIKRRLLIGYPFDLDQVSGLKAFAFGGLELVSMEFDVDELKGGIALFFSFHLFEWVCTIFYPLMG